MTALVALTVLGGCDGGATRVARRPNPRRVGANESAYHLAPTVQTADREGGRIVLAGRAQPGAPVRLATPEGRVISVVAGADRGWRITLPPSPDMRLYSLAMIDGGRMVQSEGYLAVAPDIVAQLRAGAGASSLGAATDGPRVTAVDYDSKGGCVVSGVAAPGGAVMISIDGVERGAVRGDGSGRFSLALDEPIAPGPHTIALVESGRRSDVTLDVTPPGPLPAIPIRAERTGSGWRVDWTTPGGGLQTTLLFPATKGAL